MLRWQLRKQRLSDPRLDKRRLFTKSQRKKVLIRDGNICKKCGSTENLEIDHIIEWIDFGKTELDNAQILCKTCNRNKNIEAHWKRKQIKANEHQK